MAKFYPNPDGPLRVYQMPQAGHRYVIGADVAEGIVKGKDPDGCCAQVIDRDSWEQVATWSMSACTPTTFAEKLELLGYWYNIALLAPERNNHGHTVMAILQQRRYPRFHVEQDNDSFALVPIDRPGWMTTKQSRPLAVDALGGAIASNLVTLNDIDTIEECLTFVHNKKSGKPEGDAGCHDDRVLALGIALAVNDWGPKGVPKSSVYDPHRKMDAISYAAMKDVLLHVAIVKRAERDAKDRE